MKLFWRFSKHYIGPYVWWYLLGFVCIFGTQSLAVGIVDQTKRAIDAVTASGADASTILPFAIRIIVFGLLLVVIRTTSRLLVFTPSRMIEYRIRNDYYSKLLFLQRDFLSRHESGDLVSRCSNDIGHIRAAYGFGLLQVANVSITLGLVLTAMIKLDAKTTLLLMVPMIISFAIIQGSIRYLFKYWRRSNQQIGRLSSLCLASFRGVAAIQNFHAEPALEKHFHRANREYLETAKVITRTKSFAIPLVQLVGNLSVFVVLWIVGPKVIQGDLSLGTIVAYLGYIAMVMPPLLSLGWMLNVFNQSVPAMERLSEILLAKASVPVALAGANIQEQKLPSGLVARGMTFSFQREGEGMRVPGIEDIQFELSPGKVLGIAGPVGCGKTTLLDTIVRLNALEPGQLFWNGGDVALMKLEKYRAEVSFTPQRALLFSASMRENLLMGLPAESWNDSHIEDRLLEALNCAGFQMDPKQFPEGLETQVGQKGVMLSGGQRQRMALARALLKRSEIYILDDVLSAVDHETEKAIIANIKGFAAGKSFIIAAHRVSALQWADEILVMDGGRVVDRGTHETLIGRSGFYRDIYQYQSQHVDES